MSVMMSFHIGTQKSGTGTNCGKGEIIVAMEKFKNGSQ